MINREEFSTEAGPATRAILAYLETNFNGNFVSDLVKATNRKGEDFFEVMIHHQNNLYRLIFDAASNVTNREMEQLWELCDD